MLIKTSLRALAIGLMPLAFINAVLFALALLGVSPESQNAPPRITDFVLGSWIACLCIAGGLFFIGHLVARRLGSGRRSTYAWIGGFAAAAAYAIAINTGLWIDRPSPDVVALSGILPTLFGMISGFLYAYIAGYEPKPLPKLGVSAAEASLPYDGPIQVRTSVPAMAIASLIPAIMMAVIALFVASLTLDLTSTSKNAYSQPGSFLLFALPANLFILALIATSIPTAIFVAITHATARAMRGFSVINYAVIGSLVGAVVGAALSSAGSFVLLVPCMLLGAIVSAVYRTLAGVEPLALPEPVLVRTTETLVPADHPSRKGHIVVTNS